MATSLGGNKLYPILWLILVIWFFKDSIFGHDSPRETVTSTSTSSESKSNSTLSQITDYYHHLTGSEPSTVNGHAKGLVTADVSTSNKVAVIIETRKSAAVIPLILHFSAVLGPDWPVVIYTSAENFGSFSTSNALARHQKSGRIVIRPLAEGLYFPNWDSVTAFLTTTWLWNQLAPAENILIFQADSILCANAPRSVEDFFQWDLIGAPITPQFGQGYNGGLSLRKRSTMLRVLEEFDWAENPSPRPEDQWYYARMKELAERDEEEKVEHPLRLPTMEEARSFAVETIDYPSPLGLHQPTRFLPVHMRSLEEYCPEYKLATMERIKE